MNNINPHLLLLFIAIISFLLIIILDVSVELSTAREKAKAELRNEIKRMLRIITLAHMQVKQREVRATLQKSIDEMPSSIKEIL